MKKKKGIYGYCESNARELIQLLERTRPISRVHLESSIRMQHAPNVRFNSRWRSSCAYYFISEKTNTIVPPPDRAITVRVLPWIAVNRAARPDSAIRIQVSVLCEFLDPFLRLIQFNLVKDLQTELDEETHKSASWKETKEEDKNIFHFLVGIFGWLLTSKSPRVFFFFFKWWRILKYI